MYERQFGLRENPFAAGHQSKYVYPSREHQEALAHLRFGIENREPFVLITGEVGTGKTTALYDALSEWKSRAVVALITNSALTRSELYEEICMRFGVPLAGPVSKPQLINQLERHLLVVRARGDFAILLIDEAQNLDDGLLEETRLLSNLEAQGQKLLQIFLVGQPELEEKLARPALRQLRQRIAVHYRLRPLSVDDTTHYIHHRISVAGGNAPQVFPADACAEVHAVTHGIPREINTVAAQALLNAFVEDASSVLPAHVRAIVHDTGFQSVLDAPAAPTAAGVASSAAPPDAPQVAPPASPAPAAPAPPQASSPSAASPVPVSPDAPASTREVRHVPAPAPAPPRGGDTPTQTNQAEGLTMAGVRPAGSTESWQSWMESLAKQTEESVQSPETSEASPAPGTAAPGTPQVPAEMSAEDFAAVEEEAMHAEIGGEESEEEAEHDDAGAEKPASSEPAGIRHEFDPNESQPDRVAPWSAPKLTPPAEAAAMAQAPAFESAPGFNWDAPAARRDEPAPESPRREEARPQPSAPASPARDASTPLPPATPPAAPAGSTSPTDDFDTLEVRRVEPTPPPPPPTPSPVATTRPRVAPIPPPSGPVAPVLPMRLRERLEEAERAEAAQKNGLAGWLIGAAVLAAIVVGVFLTMRFRPHARPAATPTSVTTPAPQTTPPIAAPPSAGEPAATNGDTRSTPLAAPPAAVAPKNPTVTPKSTPPATARPAEATKATATPTKSVDATKPAAAAAKPAEPTKPLAATAKPAEPTKSAAAGTKSGPATTSANTASAPAAASASVPKSKPAATTPVAAKPAAAKARFGVSVGSFLAEDRAKSESERLGAATGLAARVVTSKDGDFLVVLGAFGDRAAAEKAAGGLINSGKVEEARVVPLGASH